MSDTFSRICRCASLVGALLATSAVFPAMSGCVTPQRAYVDTYEHAQVEFINPSIRPCLRVSPPVIRRLSDNVLDAAVAVRSVSAAESVSFEYRATFFDADGVEQGSTAWTAVTLGPRDSKQLRFNSTSTTAVSFRLSLR